MSVILLSIIGIGQLNSRIRTVNRVVAFRESKLLLKIQHPKPLLFLMWQNPNNSVIPLERNSPDLHETLFPPTVSAGNGGRENNCYHFHHQLNLVAGGNTNFLP
ncbi:MAG: hypothetical protein JXR56_07355 [Candidatus Cloacimonetes bacterium]|nr:hypothetical protein [Candidatus Cloacimonadota bacterium]